MNYKHENLTSKRMLNIIEKNKMCLLGVTEENVPYIIPVYYECDYRDNTLVICIKSKSYGMKMRFMNNNDNVCLYFDNKNNNCIETIVAFGKVYIDKSSKNKKESNINIVIDKISGRKYTSETNCFCNRPRLFHYK